MFLFAGWLSAITCSSYRREEDRKSCRSGLGNLMKVRGQPTTSDTSAVSTTLSSIYLTSYISCVCVCVVFRVSLSVFIINFIINKHHVTVINALLCSTAFLTRIKWTANSCVRMRVSNFLFVQTAIFCVAWRVVAVKQVWMSCSGTIASMYNDNLRKLDK